MRKRFNKEKVLQFKKIILEKIVELSGGMVSSFFPRKYPEARIWRNILGLDDGYTFKKSNFSKVLNKLSKEGFIVRSGAKKKAVWSITSQGKKFLKNEFIYPKSDGRQRIFIFDIPEKDRKKRRWVRSELLAHGYEQLQKSVWIGDAPIAEDFWTRIQDFNLEKCVHLFSIDKKGSISFERT